MNNGRTVFAQLIAHLSHVEFQRCVLRNDGDSHSRSLSCWDQYLAMGFAAESLDAALLYLRKRHDDFRITEARFLGMIPLLSGSPLD
jgi:hypothetical protein